MTLLFGAPIAASRPLTLEEDLRITVMSLFTVFVAYSIFKHLSLASDVNKRSSSMDTVDLAYPVTLDN